MNKWIFFPLALLALSFGFISKQTVTRFPYTIPASLPFHPEWELSSLSLEESRLIFAQSYHYLGKGAQCIAFESADHQYVLKFPHHAHRIPPPWVRSLPLLKNHYEQKLARSIHKKLKKIARSSKLAFVEWREETGLIVLHCNRTSTLNCILRVTDDTQKSYTIDLDTVAFSVQKKAKLLYPALEEWMEAGRGDLARQGLANLVKFLHERYEKGLDDPEENLEGNMGFLGTRPMSIDFGHLRKSERPCDRTEEQENIERLLLPLKEKLDATYPELGAYLEHCR